MTRSNSSVYSAIETLDMIPPTNTQGLKIGHDYIQEGTTCTTNTDKVSELDLTTRGVCQEQTRSTTPSTCGCTSTLTRRDLLSQTIFLQRSKVLAPGQLSTDKTDSNGIRPIQQFANAYAMVHNNIYGWYTYGCYKKTKVWITNKQKHGFHTIYLKFCAGFRNRT